MTLIALKHPLKYQIVNHSINGIYLRIESRTADWLQSAVRNSTFHSHWLTGKDIDDFCLGSDWQGLLGAVETNFILEICFLTEWWDPLDPPFPWAMEASVPQTRTGLRGSQGEIFSNNILPHFISRYVQCTDCIIVQHHSKNRKSDNLPIQSNCRIRVLKPQIL